MCYLCPITSNRSDYGATIVLPIVRQETWSFLQSFLSQRKFSEHPALNPYLQARRRVQGAYMYVKYRSEKYPHPLVT